MAQLVLDEARTAAFLTTVVRDAGGVMAALLSAVGDRLGLFKDLARNGPATSREFAARTGIDERYAREWLRGLAAAEYLEFDSQTDRYSLPPEHAAALAEEAGPLFVASAFRMLPPLVDNLDGVVDAFVHGGGVHQASYGADWWDNMQRFTAGWYEHLLVQEWLPALPDLRAKLVRGAVAADIGCGAGCASIKLAEAFPNSRFVGFDMFAGQIELARSAASQAGVGDRVTFEVLDARHGLPDQYDLITTFDAVHESVDPPAVIRAIRNALKTDGTYLMAEMNCADDPHDNRGPLAAFFYGLSLLYCMTTSLADGGAGLGTCGLPETEVRRLCVEAGFSNVRRLPSSSMSVFSLESVLYEIK